MFACASRGAPSSDEYCCPPSTTVAKKLPGHTLSSDKRLILDARRVNLCCSKQDYWPLKTPLVGDLTTRYCKLRASFPGLEVRGTKRDVDSAFTRIRVRQDGAVLFGTEPTSPTITGDSIVFFYLVLPFGFCGSPGIFGMVMEAVQLYHRSFAPRNHLWNGALYYDAEVFADGGMFLEALVGHRCDQTADVWERGGELFFDTGAISKKKIKVEGTWGTKLALLGYEVDLASNTISLRGRRFWAQ